MPNAINLLKNDHDRLRELLDLLAQTTEEDEEERRDLVRSLEQQVRAHTQLEEEFFYPAFKSADEKAHKKMYFEAVEEHRAVGDLVLPDLVKTEPASLSFSGRAKVLKELVEHHAGEEEREMFPEAERSMSAPELEQLGARMQEYRRKTSGPR